jgi:hypothetical protein
VLASCVKGLYNRSPSVTIQAYLIVIGIGMGSSMCFKIGLHRSTSWVFTYSYRTDSRFSLLDLVESLHDEYD